MVSDAEGQAAATAAMDQSAFAHMERMLRDETRGEYTVGKMLGRGGMAVVYLAEETRLGRKVALKVLPPELTFGHGVDRFLREAKTAATLDHPNIIPIYRIASGGKLFWYAMKYLEGRSLEDVLRERGAYSVDETLEILEQVADALDYAHEHQVIHRDIKPANVMLDSRNRVIITDFGIAKALTEGALTASGSVIGTPYFMSPEQGMGKPVTGAADQYSVAVMAYRMLAGHIPFDGDSAIDILHKHCMMEPPRLEDAAPHVPKHICDAIDKALSKKAPDRFPNIKAFVKAMKDSSVRYARPSARTELIDSAELEKAISGPRPKVVPKAAAGAADLTVVAGAAPKPAAAKPAAPAAAASSSKTGLYVAIAAVVLGGGGFAAWQFVIKPQDTAPSTQVAEAPTTETLTPSPSGVAAQDSVPQQAAAATAPSSTPAPVVNTPAEQPAPAPTKAAPTTPPRQTAAAPAPSTPAPTPAAPAATGPATLQLIVNPGGTISVDGVSKGERSRLAEQVAPGEHLISVSRSGFATKDTVVTLRAGQTVRVTLTLTPTP